MENVKDLMACLEDNEYYLPIGYRDSDGRLHRTIKLRPITGEVEEAMAEPKLRENPGKIITEIIFGVTERMGTLKKVTKDIIRDLTTIDRDFILVKSSEVSKGTSELNYVDKCPHCQKMNDISLDTNHLPVKYASDDEVLELTFDLQFGYLDGNQNVHKTVTVRVPTGGVQERVAPYMRQNPAVATTMMLHAITKKLGTLDFINPEILKKLTKKDRDLINKKLGEFDFGIKMSMDTQCAQCGEDFTTYVSVTALLGE